MYNEILRNKKPLVHCITNYVTVNDVANVLLALGAAPIMADDIEEVSEIVSISDALVINIGTLNARTVESMLKAGKTANEKGVPVVLDPVGAGASKLRNKTVLRLLSEIRFSIIRGNLSEMSFIAGLSSSTRGVDSNSEDDKNDSVTVASKVALDYGCVAAVTGAVDIVTDGARVAKIFNGVPEMSKITGTGCMLSAMLGAYAAVCEDTFEAAAEAVAVMGIAGETARVQSDGTSSMKTALIDAVSNTDDGLINDEGNVKYE